MDWLTSARQYRSSHYDDRPIQSKSHKAPSNEVEGLTAHINLLVIHNISLPPACTESDFDNHFVEDFFMGCLDHQQYSIFEQLKGVRVSAHFYIKRTGELIQFVPMIKRAWHAGVSQFQGRDKCNDYSIGIELQGTDDLPYTEAQYQSLIETTLEIQKVFPNITKERIVGHCDIAPERKTDPGQSFDWHRYKNAL